MLKRFLLTTVAGIALSISSLAHATLFTFEGTLDLGADAALFGLSGSSIADYTVELDFDDTLTEAQAFDRESPTGSINDFYYLFNSLSLTLAGTTVNFSNDPFPLTTTGAPQGGAVRARNSISKGQDDIGIRAGESLFNSSILITFFSFGDSVTLDTFDNGNAANLTQIFNQGTSQALNLNYNVLDNSGQFIKEERLNSLDVSLTSITQVPEPGTWALMLLGLGALVRVNRKS